MIPPSPRPSPDGKPLDVVAIGNAIVDVVVQTEERFLDDHDLTKGTMALVDEALAERLYAGLGPGLETSGGSAANTIAGIAQLGGRAAFIGRVRDDQLGSIFAHDIRSVGARFDTPAAREGPSTARCLILVTPDAQRTMCTYLGASVDLEPADLDLDLVRQAGMLYLEGYLWDGEAAKRAFLAELRARGERRVVGAVVDPVLEPAEIHRRVIAAGGPALLFAAVRGAAFLLGQQPLRYPRTGAAGVRRPPPAADRRGGPGRGVAAAADRCRVRCSAGFQPAIRRAR